MDEPWEIVSGASAAMAGGVVIQVITNDTLQVSGQIVAGLQLVATALALSRKTAD